MRKILMTITAVGVLSVPAGLALAQSDDTVVDTGTDTTVECDQDQLRERDQLRLHDGDCELCEEAHVRVREHTRAMDANGETVRNQVRVEECDDCSGDQLMLQDRQMLHDGTGDGEQARLGPNGR